MTTIDKNSSSNFQNSKENLSVRAAGFDQSLSIARQGGPQTGLQPNPVTTGSSNNIFDRSTTTTIGLNESVVLPGKPKIGFSASFNFAPGLVPGYRNVGDRFDIEVLPSSRVNLYVSRKLDNGNYYTQSASAYVAQRTSSVADPALNGTEVNQVIGAEYKAGVSKFIDSAFTRQIGGFSQTTYEMQNNLKYVNSFITTHPISQNPIFINRYSVSNTSSVDQQFGANYTVNNKYFKAQGAVSAGLNYGIENNQLNVSYTTKIDASRVLAAKTTSRFERLSTNVVAGAEFSGIQNVGHAQAAYLGINFIFQVNENSAATITASMGANNGIIFPNAGVSVKF